MRRESGSLADVRLDGPILFVIRASTFEGAQVLNAAAMWPPKEAAEMPAAAYPSRIGGRNLI